MDTSLKKTFLGNDAKTVEVKSETDEILLEEDAEISEKDNPPAYTEVFSNYRVCSNQLFRDLVTSQGYPMEAYKVVTDDKYVLQLFRIQAKGSKITEGKQAVFMQHGLLNSADNWVLNGDKSPAFFLANNGFDVWLGNSRGNKYSRAHQTLNPKQKQFWNYSFHEMGQYDVMANVKFILEKTGQAKIGYVGHSQGTTQMFAALGTDRADFLNKKISKFIALAPVVLVRKIIGNLLISLSGSTIPNLEKKFKVKEILSGKCSRQGVGQRGKRKLCKLLPGLCKVLFGPTIEVQDISNKDLKIKASDYIPSGTSFRSLLHFRQLVVRTDKADPKFMMYDYGAKKNQAKYGRATPPEYDLGKINIPVRLYYGDKDVLALPEDVKVLFTKLSSMKKDVKIYDYEACDHSTFMWPPDKILNDVLRELKSG